MKKAIILSFAILFLFSCKKDEIDEPTTAPTINNGSGGGTGGVSDTTSIAPTGIVSTQSGSTKGLADGIGAAAQYQFPYGLFSSSTNLYATHPGNFDFITRRSPFIIRKIDPSDNSVTTLTTITENIFDNANAAIAKAATLVSIGDSLYLSYGYRLFIINNTDGNYRSTRLPATTDSYGQLFLYNGKLIGIQGNTLSEINKVDGTRTSLFVLDVSKVNSSLEVQDICLINDKLYFSTKDASLNPDDDDYELYSVDLINQTVEYIITQKEAATYGYGFDQISTDGTDIFYTSDGRNSATYTFGKIDLAAKKNHLIAAKDKGYIDGALDVSEFNSPIDNTFLKGDMYIFEQGNLKIRKVDFD